MRHRDFNLVVDLHGITVIGEKWMAYWYVNVSPRWGRVSLMYLHLCQYLVIFSVQSSSVYRTDEYALSCCKFVIPAQCVLLNMVSYVPFTVQIMFTPSKQGIHFTPCQNMYIIIIMCFIGNHPWQNLNVSIWNQDNVSEWSDMSIHRLLFRWANTTKIKLNILV
jgi:hypothetical protein